MCRVWICIIIVNIQTSSEGGVTIVATGGDWLQTCVDQISTIMGGTAFAFMTGVSCFLIINSHSTLLLVNYILEANIGCMLM